MGDNSVPSIEITNRAPSVYRIWQQVRAEGGTRAEMEDRYRELLEQYGHRDINSARWTTDSGFMKANRTISKQQGANG